MDIGNKQTVIDKQVNYPEFGQTIENPSSLNLKQMAWKAAKIGVSGMTIFSIGITVGSLSLGTAACLTLASFVIYQIAKAIFSACYSYRYRLAFEPGLNNPDAPKMGEYNKVDLRVSNHATESFEWKKALISSAQHSIELSANFAGGKDFREVLQLIEHQMIKFPELKCHLILSSDLLEEQDREYLENLKIFYPNFNCLITDRIYTTSPEILSEENHVKMLLVDGQYFVMGGTGIHEKMSREDSSAEISDKESMGAKFLDKGFRDSDLIGYGDAAQTMRNQFFNLYRIWEHRMTGSDSDHYFPTDLKKAGRCELFHQEDGLLKDSSMKYVIAGPEHRKKNPISSEIAHLIENAEEDVKIANLIFNPDTIISDSLKKAKNKNVSIQGYFNGTGENSSLGHYLYALPNRYNYDLVTDAYEYNKEAQLYHKKVMTVDARYTVIGSYNFGVKSSKCDYENVCVIDDPRVTTLMNQALKEDELASDRLTDHTLISKRKWHKLPSLCVIGFLGNLFG